LSNVRVFSCTVGPDFPQRSEFDQDQKVEQPAVTVALQYNKKYFDPNQSCIAIEQGEEQKRSKQTSLRDSD